MDGTQVVVFEETDEVSLGCLLKGHDGRGLETEIGLGSPGRFHGPDVGRAACG